MDSPVRLELAELDADAERLDELTGYLRQELLELDVDDVTAVRAGPPPPGARALDVLVVGGLLVKLADTAALRSVVSAVRRWLSRGDGGTPRTVRVEIGGDVIELSAASDADQERLVELFVERHSGAGS
ncbi:MAG TPA: hypothetical protein VK894_02015 [Jiangellales bacterium]|nr:hypothetical protein [Jiangellales bacterium]